MTGRTVSAYVVMNENSLLRINALKRIVLVDQMILHENTSAAFLFGRGSAGRVFGEKATRQIHILGNGNSTG
jgi:hypothetical protein